MFLSKHKIQSIQNTQQTVMWSAIPLQLLQNHTECRSSVFIFLKSKTYQINVWVIFRYQNAVIQTRLFAPTLGGTRKLKTRHVEFPPGFRRENASTRISIQNKSARKLHVLRRRSWHDNRAAAKIMAWQSCCGEDHGMTIVLRRRSWHDNPPPHDFRQQYKRPRFCPNIGENNTTIVEAGFETRTNS